MQRRTLGAVTLAAALLALPACGGGSDGGADGGATAARGPITLWLSNNEQEVAWGTEMVAAWNAAHPDEQITAQEIPAGGSSEEVIGAAVTAGTAPCLVFNTAPSAVGQLERQGGLVDLASFPDGAAYVEERSGAVADQYRSADGGFRQLPWKSNPVMIFYNKTLFAQAGLDPENPDLATYDGFLNTARTLVSAGVSRYAINPAASSEFYQTQFDFLPLYAAQTGGTPLVQDGAATFADDAGYGVAEFWRAVYAEGLAGQEAYQGDAFADGYAAMAIVGPWAVSLYDDVEWGTVPVPTAAGTPAADTWTFSDAKNVGLFSACDNQATAWDVLKFATSEEQDRVLLETTGQMPLRADLATTYADYFTANPAYELFGDQAARTIEVPAGPNTVRMLQTVRDAWTRSVIAGQGDVRGALDEAAAQVGDLAAQG